MNDYFKISFFINVEVLPLPKIGKALSLEETESLTYFTMCSVFVSTKTFQPSSTVSIHSVSFSDRNARDGKRYASFLYTAENLLLFYRNCESNTQSLYSQLNQLTLHSYN